MKYRDISLIGKPEYNLVKYNDGYSFYLDELKDMNKKLADYVESMPKLFSELSDTQSYMIFYGDYTCVGAIFIGTSTDEKDLEIEVQFNEEYFESKKQILDALEQVVESLKLYFYDKENIVVRFDNDIDLSKVNRYKYEKKVYDENLTTYTCSNKYNNTLLPKLINEITETEENLINWGQNWSQIIKYNDLSDYFSEKPPLNYIQSGQASLAEILYRAKLIEWCDIDSKNSKRNIEFSKDGQVHFSKESYKIDGIDYEFKYNVLSDDFNCIAYNSITYNINNNYRIEIEKNGNSTNIKFNDSNITFKNKNNGKELNYKSPIPSISDSIDVQLYINEYDEIDKCYIDFRTHKGNGKINGVYALRLEPKFNIFTLKFISRDGTLHRDFSQMLACEDEKLYSNILSGNLTVEIVDELIKKVIPVINGKIAKSSGDKQYISEPDGIISDIENIRNQVVNFIKQIKEEIPLPHLQENLDKFVKENDKNKKIAKQRKL